MFGKAVSGVCSDMRALHSTHREREIDREWEIDREKERETERGVERSEWRAQKKKKQRTESMLEERVRPLANPIEASFFPLFPLQLYLSLPLHARFLSIASECASAKLSPPIWHRVPDRSANTHAWRAEWEGGRDGGRVKETEREQGGGVGFGHWVGSLLCQINKFLSCATAKSRAH